MNRRAQNETSWGPERASLVFFCATLAAGLLAAPLTGGCRDPQQNLRGPPSSSPSDDSGEPPASCPSISDDAGAGEPLRVASFNVRRLFDTDCDSDDCGAGSYESVPSRRAYEDRLSRIADRLSEVDADILLLQEIETAGVFSDLAAALADRGADYDVRTFGETSRPGSLDVGILSEGEKTGMPMRYRERRMLTRPDGTSTTFTREFLGVPLEWNGEPVVVFTAHFKSRRDDDPGRRLAEARAAGSIVSETAQKRDDALVVFGGDLNTTPGDRPFRQLTRESGLRRAGGNESSTPWSYCFEGRREAIDHLFVAPNCGGALIRGSARRWGGSQCPGASGFAGSDHAAISAEFALE